MNFKKGFLKISDVIDSFEKNFCFLLLLATVVVGFLQVVCRFAHMALPWSEELLRFCFVWLTFMGAGLGFKTGSHLSVEFFTSLLPLKTRRILVVIVYILVLVFANQVFERGVFVVKTAIASNMKSAAMHIPMWIPYLGVCLPFFLTQFQIVAACLRHIWSEKEGDEA